MKSSKPAINNSQPKQYKCDKPYFKKGCFDNPYKENSQYFQKHYQKMFMEISTNNESDNNDKSIEVDKLEVEHAKEQE